MLGRIREDGALDELFLLETFIFHAGLIYLIVNTDSYGSTNAFYLTTYLQAKDSNSALLVGKEPRIRRRIREEEPVKGRSTARSQTRKRLDLPEGDGGDEGKNSGYNHQPLPRLECLRLYVERPETDEA
jgi:hypothetical protein